ncbi:MAG: flagellar filament capping protein FliD [Rubrivivax sp.]|nr:flagellar filament capping protein FliD [Rubrivivax sp.]
MPAITSLGIGSGVDINSMVSQLVALESRPLVAMRNEAKSLQTQVSSYGQLSSLLGTLQTAAGKLTSATLWTRATATSSDDSAVAVAGGSSAAPGSYAVSVQKLAASQTVVSTSSYSAATELVGSGTLTLDIGRWDLPPMNFVPQVGRAPVTVTTTASDTLQTLRDKINGLGAGVTAAIVTDSSGARLSLRSTATGADNGFRISASDADGNATDAAGLSRFAFDPAAGNLNTEQKVPAANALATVNGITVSSASNELSTVVDGLTLRLRKEGPGSVDLTVTSDREAVKTAVKEFADAYNALAKTIGDQTKYDAASKVGGPLQGDSAATGLQRQLRSLLNTASGASAQFARLSDIGLELQRDGTLKVDGGKLDSATGNLAELKKAFANSDLAQPQNDGFARRYATLATQILGSDGTLTTRTEGLRERLSRNSDNQTRLGERVERYQARLVAQYTAMDANLAKLNSLQSYMTQQLAALTASNNPQK